MKAVVSEAQGAVLLSLSGEITSRDDQKLVSDLLAEKLAEGELLFILDLSQVPYVSSLGIAVLVAAYVKVNLAKGTLKLVNPRPRVASILEMTKLTQILRTYSSVEEALSAD